MKTLQPNETELVGNWLGQRTNVHGDETCDRIKWLVENVLIQIGYSREYGAWEILYQDPYDHRFWVKTYPHSEMHGGGPPALICIPKQEANMRFILLNSE